MPTTALNLAVRRPSQNTLTCRVARRIVICHLVTAGVVERVEIQPVWLSGLPGRSTFSQCAPCLPVAWPTTGSTVRSPVIGRTSLTSATRLEPRFGFENAPVS